MPIPRPIRVGKKCRVSVKRNAYGEYEVNSYVGRNRIAQAFETDASAAAGTQKAEAKWLRQGKYARICHGEPSSVGLGRGRKRKKTRKVSKR